MNRKIRRCLVFKTNAGPGKERVPHIPLGSELVSIPLWIFFTKSLTSYSCKLGEACSTRSTEGGGVLSYEISSDVKQNQTAHSTECIR